MILPSETRFVDETVKESFYKLEKGDSSEKELFRFIFSNTLRSCLRDKALS